MKLSDARFATTLALLIFAALLWPATVFAADPSVKLDLVVPPETMKADTTSGEMSGDTLKEITNEAAERIRKRLKAAEIKHWDVVTSGPNQIRVNVYSSYSRGQLASMLVPAGAMSIRPTIPVGDRWTELLSNLPEGVELRQPGDSMKAEAAFLWSRSRRTLESAIESVALPGLEVATYPYKGGWRTVAMGSPVATHRSVQSISIERGGSGDAYIRLNLDAAAAPEQSARRGVGSQWAMVLDGEIVRLWRESGQRLDTSINIRPPSHLNSRDAKARWAQQVAGRLAAHIPVPLVEVEDVDED